MNLLREGIEQNLVFKTTLTRKVTLDGVTKALPVYRISLDLLFYNDQNDRIATWISAYRAEHDGQGPDISDVASYNSIIEQFIVDSNPEAIKNTQKNIQMFDQREPGVVLSDGRIIDGNRRFTCLRRLKGENSKFGWFEAVILDRDIRTNAKQIKMLELAIQHGEESKVDYNPTDRLVGIYHDLIETQLLTVEEYAQSTNQPIAKIQEQMGVAQLLVEFLEFINAPKQFYIARDLFLTFPIEELYKILKKYPDEDEREDLKIAVFTNILLQPSGDMVRFVRNFKQVMGSEYQDEFLSEQREVAEKAIEAMPTGKVTPDVIRDVIRADSELTDQLSRSMDKALTKVRKNEVRNRPLQLVQKASDFVEGIDPNVVQKLNEQEMSKLVDELDRLAKAIDIIRESLK